MDDDRGGPQGVRGGEPNSSLVSEAEIVDRLAKVRERLALVGRPDVRIIGVTKSFPASVVASGVAAGLVDFGESYAQEFVAKATDLADTDLAETDLRWHFIGGLQRNKVRKIAEFVDLWHSVDRVELVNEIGKRTTEVGKAKILLQVDIFGEEQKGGCAPADVDHLLDAAREAGVTVAGLMAMAPYGDPEQARSGFAALARMGDELDLADLSMGMSGDFDVAASEGATMVRVGSAIFGPRQ